MSREAIEACTASINSTRKFLGVDLFTCEGCRDLVGSIPGDEALTSFRYHMLMRVRSLAKACHLRLQYNLADPASSIILLQKQYDNFATLLKENKKLSPKEIDAVFQNFVYDLVDLIHPNCPKKKRKLVLKELGQAEVYSITFHDNEAKTNIEVGAGIYQIQTQNAICRRVKEKYTALLDSNIAKPSWFKDMPPWEKVFVMQAVQRSGSMPAVIPEDAPEEEAVNYKTKDFFSMKTPTGGSRPGGSNFGRDVFTVSEGDQLQKGVFYYLSTPSKYSQDEATAVLLDFFENNVDQMIADFKDKYDIGNVAENNVGKAHVIPVLLESLLTPVWYDKVAQAMMKGFSDNNSRMVQYKHAAITELRRYLNDHSLNADGNIYTFSLIENNQPLNGRRSHMMVSDAPRRVAGKEIIMQSLRCIMGNNNFADPAIELGFDQIEIILNQAFNNKNPEQLFKDGIDFSSIENINFGKYTLYIEALKAYATAWSRGKMTPDSENYALYLASCETILMQEAGGVVQVNCKSTKDRAGLLKSTNTFHRLCVQNGWGFPRYGEQFIDQRQRDLFADCVTRIPGEIANRVAPGCCGIKDEPFMKDAMTPTFATEDQRFKLNKMLAKTNHIKEKKLPSGELATKVGIIKTRNELEVPEPGETVDSAVTRYLDNPSMEEPDQSCFNNLDSKGAVNNDLLRYQLYKQIFELKAEKSQKCGITHKVVQHTGSPVSGYAKFTLVRDARNMNVGSVDDEKLNAYNYAQVGLTYAIAAETVFELENLSDLCRRKTGREVIDEGRYRAAINEAVQEFKAKVLTLETEEEQRSALDEFIIQSLVPMVEEASGHGIRAKDALRLLNQTKNWVAMYQPTLAVATVDKVNDSTGVGVTVVRAEEPLTQLTPELLGEYRNRANKAWYQCQSDRVKKLIDHFLPFIVAGHQIPSQLRRYLPGLKNSYRSTTSCVRRNGDHVSLQKLSDSHHCAAIVPVIMPNHGFLEKCRKKEGVLNPLASMPKKAVDKLMRKERIRLTKLGLLQQRSITGSDSNTMVALNSVMADDMLAMKDFFKGTKTEALDKEMALVTLAAAKELPGTSGAKVCLNEFRLFEPNQDKAIKVFGKKVKRFLRLYRNKYETNNTALVVAMQASLDRLKKRYSTSRIKRFFNKLDKESVGAKLVQEFTLLSELYNRMLSTMVENDSLHETYKPHVPFYACASGENRTGIIEFAAQVGALEYNLLAMERVEVDVRAAISKLAASGHVQYITGSQGGILGTESIRDKSLGSLLKKMKFAENMLSKKYAGYKSPDKKAVSKLLKTHGTSAIANHVGAGSSFFDISEIFTPDNAVTMHRLGRIGDALQSLKNSQGSDLNFIGKEEGRILAISDLLADQQALLEPGIDPDEFSNLAKGLMKKLASFSFNILNAAAWREETIPKQIKLILAEMSELVSNPDLRAVAYFTEKDLKAVKTTLKKNRYFKIGAVAGLAFTSLFFPITALVGAKLSGIKALAAIAGVSLKSKIAADVAMAGAVGLAARSRASMTENSSTRNTFGTLFNRAEGTGSVETMGVVMKNMVQFTSILTAFKDKFRISKKTPVFVTRSCPLSSDLRREEINPSVDILSERQPTRNNIVVQLDLHYSKKHSCKVLNKKLAKDVGGSEARPRNRVSLSFYRNNLQYIQVDRGGGYVPASTLVNMLHDQGKTEVVLSGVLSESFVKDVHKAAAKFHPPMRVKDNRDFDVNAEIHGSRNQGMQRGA